MEQALHEVADEEGDVRVAVYVRGRNQGRAGRQAISQSNGASAVLEVK